MCIAREQECCRVVLRADTDVYSRVLSGQARLGAWLGALAKVIGVAYRKEKLPFHSSGAQHRRNMRMDGLSLMARCS